MTKDIHERNNLVKWGILIGIVFFTVLTALILFADFEIFRNPAFVKDIHIRISLIFLTGVVTAIVINKFIKYLAQYLNFKYLERFERKLDLGTFKEAEESIFFREKEYDHVVLLLHGFTASPQEFSCLLPKLEAAGIDYVSMNILGFGIDQTVILNDTRRFDWYRSVLQRYLLLTKIAKKVSIVGHSMGAILATYIAERYHVHQLILTGPGLYSVKSDLKYKKLLTLPLISSFYIMLIPYLPKPIRKGRATVSDTLDNSNTHKLFQYLAIPIRSVREIFKAQDDVHIQKVKCDNLSVIYGTQDLTTNIDELFSCLDQNQVKYNKYALKNSAHNVLEDFDRELCCQLIVDILKS